MQASWHGVVRSPKDAYILLEAARTGLLPKVSRRLTDLERIRLIKPGNCFIFEEYESSIRRWTDQCKWSPSRVSGAFLIYTEILMDPSRQPGSGLYKQSFSASLTTGQKLHLIAYYDRASLDSGNLPTVDSIPQLAALTIPRNIYPDQRAAQWGFGFESQHELLRRTSPARSRSPSSPPTSERLSRAGTPVSFGASPIASLEQPLWRPPSAPAYYPASQLAYPRPADVVAAASFSFASRPVSAFPASPAVAKLPPLEAVLTSAPPRTRPAASPPFAPLPYSASSFYSETPASAMLWSSRRHSDQPMQSRAPAYFASSYMRPRSSEDQRQLDLLSIHLRL